MDSQTLNYYDRDAAEMAAKYRAVDSSHWRRRFQKVFMAGSRVLDVGSGSGRDLALLLEMGFTACGIEPAEGMRAEAVRAYPQLAGRILNFGLPLPKDADLGGLFDGAVCSAVLMHVPEAELFDAAFSLKRVLKEKGRLLISVPQSRPGLDSNGRDETGRLFKPLHLEYLVKLLEPLGFQVVRRWEEEADVLNRAGVCWNSFLLELDGTVGGCSNGVQTANFRFASGAQRTKLTKPESKDE